MARKRLVPGKVHRLKGGRGVSVSGRFVWSRSIAETRRDAVGRAGSAWSIAARVSDRADRLCENGLCVWFEPKPRRSARSQAASGAVNGRMTSAISQAAHVFDKGRVMARVGCCASMQDVGWKEPWRVAVAIHRIIEQFLSLAPDARLNRARDRSNSYVVLRG